MKIAIDAGHGRFTAGKRCLKSLDENQTREWTLNSRIASRVAEHLERCGAEVLRTDDPSGQLDVPLSRRTMKANSWGADWFVSIHHNSGAGGTAAGGPMVFVYNRAHSTKSDELQRAGCRNGEIRQPRRAAERGELRGAAGDKNARGAGGGGVHGLHP